MSYTTPKEVILISLECGHFLVRFDEPGGEFKDCEKCGEPKRVLYGIAEDV